MAIPAIIVHNGALAGSPSTGGDALALQEILNTSFQGTYGSSKSARPGIVNATDLAPYTIPLETITKVRMIAIRLQAGATIKVRLTSAVGTDQSFNVSGLFLWQGQNAGDEVTAIKLVGNADLVYAIAGDVS